MAIRLDKAFAGGAETWLLRPMEYDLAQVRKRAASIVVQPIGSRSARDLQPKRF
jgi:plasmid maintenance system antidote protein VapI